MDSGAYWLSGEKLQDKHIKLKYKIFAYRKAVLKNDKGRDFCTVE